MTDLIALLALVLVMARGVQGVQDAWQKNHHEQLRTYERLTEWNHQVSPLNDLPMQAAQTLMMPPLPAKKPRR